MVPRQEQILESIAASLRTIAGAVSTLNANFVEHSKMLDRALNQDVDIDKLQENVRKLKAGVDGLTEAEKTLDEYVKVRLDPKDLVGVKVRVKDEIPQCGGWMGRVKEILGKRTIGVKFPHVDGVIYFDRSNFVVVPEDEAPTDDLLTEDPPGKIVSRELLERFETGIPEVGSIQRPRTGGNEYYPGVEENPTIGDSIKSHGWGGRPPTDEEIDKPITPEAMKALEDHLDRVDPKDDLRSS